ncbi:MAG: NAD(P)H-dependent oxidoreductase [Chitinophagales bacterium]
MKIIAFAGSTSSKSINKKLVNYALSFFEADEKQLLDINDYEMPLFSVDRESEGYPQEAQDFVKILGQADLIITSLAEHNSAYTAAFKNLMDWCSRYERKFFQDKALFLMSTSPGKRGGANVMNLAQNYFPRAGANIVESFSLPSFKDNFDAEKGITDDDLKKSFLEKIDLVKEAV